MDYEKERKNVSSQEREMKFKAGRLGDSRTCTVEFLAH